MVRKVGSFSFTTSGWLNSVSGSRTSAYTLIGFHTDAGSSSIVGWNHAFSREATIELSSATWPCKPKEKIPVSAPLLELLFAFKTYFKRADFLLFQILSSKNTGQFNITSKPTKAQCNKERNASPLLQLTHSTCADYLSSIHSELGTLKFGKDNIAPTTCKTISQFK